VICVIAPVRPGAGNDDRAETGLDFAASSKNGRECGLSFLAPPVPDIHGFLITHLPPDCPALDERTAQRSRQSSSNSKPSGPHGRIPLIHAAHHPPAAATVATPDDLRGGVRCLAREPSLACGHGGDPSQLEPAPQDCLRTVCVTVRES
jgi:hypothetical protein